MAGKLPIVIINGKGGCGKDSLIEGLIKCDWWAYNVSSVDKVKEAGAVLGWDGGKSDKDCSPSTTMVQTHICVMRY